MKVTNVIQQPKTQVSNRQNLYRGKHKYFSYKRSKTNVIGLNVPVFFRCNSTPACKDSIISTQDYYQRIYVLQPSKQNFVCRIISCKYMCYNHQTNFFLQDFYQQIYVPQPQKGTIKRDPRFFAVVLNGSAPSSPSPQASTAVMFIVHLPCTSLLRVKLYIV